jgi:hypothetical protein
VVDLFSIGQFRDGAQVWCASFLSVLKNVNNVANHVNIKFIVVIIIQSITDKVINQIPLRICKQFAVNGLGKCVRHGGCLRNKCNVSGILQQHQRSCATSETVSEVPTMTYSTLIIQRQGKERGGILIYNK